MTMRTLLGAVRRSRSEKHSYAILAALCPELITVFLSMSGDARGKRWRVPVFLGGLTLFFYWKVLFTNRAMFPWDAVSFFYPYLSFVHEELRHFRLPLWDPYVLS